MKGLKKFAKNHPILFGIACVVGSPIGIFVMIECWDEWLSLK